MKLSEREAKPLIVAQIEVEARRLAGSVSENQLRFLQVAKAKGKDLEPVGVLAGARA